MLIDNYESTKHKTINHDGLYKYIQTLKEDQLERTTNNLVIPQSDISFFDTLTIDEARALFNEQLSLAVKTTELFLEYGLISKQQAQLTIKQYEIYFITPRATANDVTTYQVFNKKQALQYIEEISRPSNIQTMIDKSNYNSNYEKTETITSLLSPEEQHPTPNQYNPPNTYNQHNPHNPPFANDSSSAWTIWISRQSIRDITWYTYRPVPKWSRDNTPVFIKWQKDLLEDKSDILVVDGSRQMGKSHVTAQFIVEESFIEWDDILVGAFLQKTTDVILRYIKKHIANFDESIFVENKQKNYITNTTTGVTIHFRTFSDDAQNVLWLTLRLVVIDEAQLIDPFIFDEVLDPATSTTDSRFILIGTAIEDTSSYMYYVIESLQNGVNFNTPNTPTARYIRVSVDENPLTHPKKRASIQARKNEPAIQRQYYNRWGKMEDSLFNPTTIPLTNFQKYIPHPRFATAVLWIDPARTADHSGYSINVTYQGKTVTVESWFVPPSIQSSWIYQANFFKNIITRLKETYQSVYTVLDVTWVGDWVKTIFQQNELPINHTIRYTDGLNETQIEWTLDYRVGKPALINNFLNIINTKDTDSYALIQEMNQALTSELMKIQLKETSKWQMWFTTKWYDDVTNATMIALFIIQKRNLLSKYKSFDDPESINPKGINQIKEDLKLYQPRNKSRMKVPSRWW